MKQTRQHDYARYELETAFAVRSSWRYRHRTAQVERYSIVIEQAGIEDPAADLLLVLTKVDGIAAHRVGLWRGSYWRISGNIYGGAVRFYFSTHKGYRVCSPQVVVTKISAGKITPPRAAGQFENPQNDHPTIQTVPARRQQRYRRKR